WTVVRRRLHAAVRFAGNGAALGADGGRRLRRRQRTNEAAAARAGARLQRLSRSDRARLLRRQSCYWALDALGAGRPAAGVPLSELRVSVGASVFGPGLFIVVVAASAASMLLGPKRSFARSFATSSAET